MADSIAGFKNDESPSVGVRHMVLRSQAGHVGREPVESIPGGAASDDDSTRTQ